MTELKNSTESFNIRRDQEEKEPVNWKSDHLRLSSQRNKKTNNKRVKKAYGTHGIPSRNQYKHMGAREVAEKEKGAENVFK